MANLERVMKVSLAQFTDLISGQTVSGYTFNENTLYLIDELKYPYVTWPKYGTSTTITSSTSSWTAPSKSGWILCYTTYASSTSHLVFRVKMTSNSNPLTYEFYQGYSGSDWNHAPFAIIPVNQDCLYQIEYSGGITAIWFDAL